MNNEYKIYDDYVEIFIKSNTYGDFIIKADLEDLNLLQENNWSILKCWNKKTNKEPNFYAVCSKRVKTKYKSKMMHRILINAPDKMVVDHINHDTYDNRKSNLRLCTQAENLRNAKQYITNKSGRRGVCWDQSTNRWMAYIMKDYTHHTLGYFKNIDDAIECRQKAEIQYFGEFMNKEIV